MLGYENVGLDKFFVWNYNNYLEKKVVIVSSYNISYFDRLPTETIQLLSANSQSRRVED